MRYLLISALLLGTGLTAQAELTGKQILARIDKNYESKTSVSVMHMTIKGRRGSRTVTSKSWSMGQEKTFTEYLSPPREAGTKMLKIEDELWIWSPSTDRIIKIAGHMLRQSLMGSDVSYEDFMEDPVLENNYDVKVLEDKKVAGRLCYSLELTAKEGKEVPYYKRVAWVDKERFLPLQENMYAKSGKLLKTFETKDYHKKGERYYPKTMIFKDVLKKGDGTEIVIDEIEFDVEIPKSKFSKASLRR